MSAAIPNHLDPSDLGTKQYWDEAYARELVNHAERPDDEGTVWFADSGAEEKMIDFLETLADDGILQKELGIDTSSFLDLGTGNGHLLFSLRDEGWCGTMLGVDYSSTSLELARQIGQTRLASQDGNACQAGSEAEDHAEDGDAAGATSTIPVFFEEYDIFHPISLPNSPPGGFNVVLDKGTFDAISLSSDIGLDGRRLCESYCARLKSLIQQNGYFLITSCNWTENELRAWFEESEDAEARLVFHDRIKYPSFTFGGKTGQSVVTLCFRNGTGD
ncbi:hypothetical protein EJ08DRAFT_120173 [Tothia fuscella]|uniref:Protein-lysine N-methyltransferase EFM4 n=1 Tax=Tothia fuscella TaxID=1048955 RepID=A0A9P4TS74_9PEZI|nr:hypothetical protein EJ08DRAFT_120173 [Tothia fuscella]